MVYKPGDVFNDYFLGAVQCVKDNNSGCEDCVFNEDGSSCPPECYNEHPCYHTDRGDELDVHFVKV